MVLKKRSLTDILENNNNNEPQVMPSQPPQTPQIQIQVAQPQPPQHMQLQTVQTPAVQPPAAPRQVASEVDWGELLIKLLASAPEDVAQKLAACIDRETIAKVLERRNDPFLKVALLLLTKK